MGLIAPAPASGPTLFIATGSFLSPDTTVWLANQRNTVAVALSWSQADSYAFDAISNQLNICLPDTAGNTVSGGLSSFQQPPQLRLQPPPLDARGHVAVGAVDFHVARGCAHTGEQFLRLG